MDDNDQYIRDVVARHAPNALFITEDKINELRPYIYAWANGHAYNLKLSGSLAKGTGIADTTDIDIFISLDPSVSTCNTLENVYNTLRNKFSANGYAVREQMCLSDSIIQD